VVQGTSKTFNPSLGEAVIAAQRAADPTAASSEWDAEFRSDISAFLDDALIDGAVEHGRPLELPPAPGVYYKGFVDASGGVGSDSYTLAIGHRIGEHCIVDVVRGTKGQFDPQAVTSTYADLLKECHVRGVSGDHYAAEWVSRTWSRLGISYTVSEQPKSGLYLETIQFFARGLVRLPDHARLLRELRLLERHTHRSGKDTVDHPRGGHDDHANAVCGLLSLLSTRVSMPELYSTHFTEIIAASVARPYRYDPMRRFVYGSPGIGERRAAQMARARERRWM
jgi:hypothetical protein